MNGVESRYIEAVRNYVNVVDNRNRGDIKAYDRAFSELVKSEQLYAGKGGRPVPLTDITRAVRHGEAFVPEHRVWGEDPVFHAQEKHELYKSKVHATGADLSWKSPWNAMLETLGKVLTN